MFGQSGFTGAVSALPAWSVQFAREPEPDLDLDQSADMDKTVVLDPSGLQSSYHAKPPNRRPVLVVLLLLILGGGAYLYTNPDLLSSLLGGIPGNEASIPPAPKVMAPPTGAATPSPVAPTAPASGTLPAQVTPPAPSTIPIPAFMEGQRVAIVADPANPTGAVTLTADSSGTQPGPTISLNSTLTVLDADLQSNIWIYSVRTESGATGWIAESRLKAKS